MISDLFDTLKRQDFIILWYFNRTFENFGTGVWISCKRFKQNQMIVNADKFQVIILNKKESEAKYKLIIDKNDIEYIKSVTWCINWWPPTTGSIHIKFVFQSCCHAVKCFRSTTETYRKTWKSCNLSFSYCALFWHFINCKLVRKIEKIQKRYLRIVLNDYDSNYDVLLRKSGKVTMVIKRLRALVTKILKKSLILNRLY